MTTTQLSGRSRICGDAPGCMRARHPQPTASAVANCAAPASPPSASSKTGGNSIPQLRVPCSLLRPRTLWTS
eukprot:3466269-Prymnesium_polylepis.1